VVSARACSNDSLGRSLALLAAAEARAPPTPPITKSCSWRSCLTTSTSAEHRQGAAHWGVGCQERVQRLLLCC